MMEKQRLLPAMKAAIKILEASTGAKAAHAEAMTRAEAAEARVKTLEELLKPFAEAARCFADMPIKDPEQWFAYSGRQSNDGTGFGAITVGDLRRAAKVVK